MLEHATDLRELPPEDAVDVPADARQRAEFARAVVEAATSREPTRKPWPSGVRCVETPWDDEVCAERVEVHRVKGGTEIAWLCPGCAAHGIMSGVEGSPHDLSRYIPRGKLSRWGMSGAQRELLWEATRGLPHLRAVIARSISPSEIDDALLVSATVRELDDLYTLVEQLTDGTRSRRRLALLEGLRFSLSTSIDGF